MVSCAPEVEARLASVQYTAASVSVFEVCRCATLQINLTKRSRYTGDSESSTKELTRGLVRTASIRSQRASFPRPNRLSRFCGDKLFKYLSAVNRREKAEMLRQQWLEADAAREKVESKGPNLNKMLNLLSFGKFSQANEPFDGNLLG